MGLFRSVPLAESVLDVQRLPAGLAGHPRDSVVLGWSERMSLRGRWTTEGGVEFGASLPRGTVLAEGQALAIDHPPLLILVRAKLEPVLVAHPASTGQAVLWAYQLGNAHLPLMLEAGFLICLDERGVDEVFAFHAIPFSRDTRAFTPVSQGPGHHTGS